MSNYEDVYAPDLTEETESTLSGAEQFVMFDSVEGKRAELSTIADYIVANGEIDGSDIPTIVSTIEGNIGTLDTKVGDLTDLDTTDKTDIVSAVNEVNGKADTVDAHVGDLSDLDTADKTSAVDAINEVLSKIPVMTKEVTGNPITVDDALGEVQSLNVELEPVQDLHGYDKPWAAGAGKNMVNVEDSTSTTFSRSGETFINTDTDTRTAEQLLCQAYNGNTYMRGSSVFTVNDGRYHGTITIPSEVTSLRLKHNGMTKDLVIYFPWTEQGTFTVSCSLPKKDPTVVGGLVITDIMVTNDDTYTPFQPYSNICPITGHDSVTITDTDGTSTNTTTVTLPSTVYGGDVDVTGGAGTEKYGIVDLGSLSWTYTSNGVFYTTDITNHPNVPWDSTTLSPVVSEIYSSGFPKNAIDKTIYFTNSGVNMYVKDTAYSSTSTFTTAMSGVYAVYELATPTDLTTTPTSVTLYNGDNVVSADGDMDMVYVRDIVKVIEKLEG